MSKKYILAFGIFVVLILSYTICFASYTSPYPEPTVYLKKGTSGLSVKWVQDMLNHCGYNLSIDGIFGANTHQAVINFQSKQALQIDGIVGPNTIRALKNLVSNSTSNLTINEYLYTNTNVNLRQGPRYQLFNQNHLSTKYESIRLSNSSRWLGIC